MKRIKTALSISGILGLVIVICVIAGCLTLQPDTVTVTTTPTASAHGISVTEDAAKTTPAYPVRTTAIVRSTVTVQKTTIKPTISQSPATPTISQIRVSTTQNLVSGSVISIGRNDFLPAVIVINPGTKVTLTNKDSVPHLIASDTGAPASFRSDTIAPGGTYTFTLTKSGTYTFHCTLVNGPPGTIIVN